MKILWLTWKDRKNPSAGGAELINENLIERLAQNGHEVIMITAGFPNSPSEERINGYKIIRLGNRWSVYWRAYRYYKNNLNGWPDLVIDEINTVPFFAKFYVKEKNILFVHQLCRRIWFYEMFFPLSLLGYALEPIYLRLLRDRQVITVSESTKKDLLKRGFNPRKIQIIREGVEIEPHSELSVAKDLSRPAMLAFGSVRPMKRTDHLVRAFEIAKKRLPSLRLVVAGALCGNYGQVVLRLMKQSDFADSIDYLGPVSREEKIKIFDAAAVICVSSVKEGWGLIVTEAARRGTPAIVYNADGLRDAVKNHETGLVCLENYPGCMADNLVCLLKNSEMYERLRQNAWRWSKTINFERSYNDFINVLNNI